MMRLSHERLKTLAYLVQKHPWLYDSRHQSYKDNEKRSSSWEQIAQIWDPSMRMTGKTLAVAWRNQRDHYMRLRRKVYGTLPNKPPRGSGRHAAGAEASAAAAAAMAAAAAARKWPLYPVLDNFLSNCGPPRRTKSGGGDSFPFGNDAFSQEAANQSEESANCSSRSSAEAVVGYIEVSADTYGAETESEIQFGLLDSGRSGVVLASVPLIAPLESDIYQTVEEAPSLSPMEPPSPVTSDCSASSAARARGSKRRRVSSGQLSQFQDQVLTCLRETMLPKQEDDCDHFCRGMAERLRRLDRETRLGVEIEMLQLLKQAEFPGQ